MYSLEVLDKGSKFTPTYTVKEGQEEEKCREVRPLRMAGVSGFFEGRSVFMTGGSGFLGKVILEKLLRDCPGLKNVYVLLRAKQGHDSRRRVEELLSSVVFGRLRRDNPEALRKVIAISGDITYPDLGISQVDLRTLKENVSVVFHSAATIRFDEPLK